MDDKAKFDAQASRQLPKLKSLLKKYRQLKTMQTGLLQLSELASKVTTMDAFYPALVDVVSTLLIADSFHIALVNNQQKLSLAFCHNPQEQDLLSKLEQDGWLYSLTGLVYRQQTAVHCNAAEQMALASANKVRLLDSSCTDWLGVPLKRGHHTIGVMALKSYDNKLYFDDRDCQLLEFIAEHIVTAIDRVKNREYLEQSIIERTQKLTEANQKLQQEIRERQKIEQVHTALLEIAQMSSTEQTIDDFYRNLHQRIKPLLPAQNLYIGLLTQDLDHVEYPYFVDERLLNPGIQPSNSVLLQLVLEAAAPVLVTSKQIKSLADVNQLSVKTINQQRQQDNMSAAWLAAPLIEQGQIFGVLTLQDYHDPNAYQDSDLSLIRFISQHIATAVLRKRRQQQAIENKIALERMVDQRTQALQQANDKLVMQIEERKKAEAQLYFDAHHDTLTRLPNRAMFSDRLAHALKHLKRHPNHRFAVLFIDLDRFKMINDTLGHQAGDEFLIEIAKRLKYCVRDNDLLARLGGDEFVILLDSPNSQEDIEEIATRIIDHVSLPFEIQENQLFSNASIGIAPCRQHYQNADEILRDADAAMYQAKALGRGRYVFFDDSMREQLIATMTLEQELRVALEQQQFELHYQEISNLNDPRPMAFEALLRWRHPSKGLLSPEHFLLTAEENGLILAIEAWVVEQVCQQLQAWQQHDDYQHVFISINLSGKHLIQANKVNQLIKLIEQSTEQPERLILEFNEAAFLQNTELALRALRKLKSTGVKLALDDYCSGFSSFSFLHSYPFEFIKLDRSFIKAINTSDKNLTLIKALHQLGEQFGYRLVAEGIESQNMLNKLQQAGCEFGQGYHISRPAQLASSLPEKETGLSRDNLSASA